MSNNEILSAIEQICDEKNISFDSVIETIEAALAVAYRKDFGEKNQNIKVAFDPETSDAKVFDVKEVVEDMELEEEEVEEKEEKEAEKKEKPKKEEKEKKAKGEKDEKEEKDSESEEDEDEKPKFNPKTQLMITEAKGIKKDAKIGDEIKTELKPPEAYGRMAAQTAKQVIIQKLREAERETLYNEFKKREGQVINGTVQRIEGRVVLIDLGHTTAVLPPQERIENEKYIPGHRFKIFIVSVNLTTKGPEIVVSRSHPEIVRQLFTLEVPEIASGAIEIKSISREAGSRSKIAVFSNQKNIDPVGSCVGQRGTRVQTIISELGGEKIDIIEFDDDPVKFITNALSPAKVLSVKIDEENKEAIAEVKEDQLSLAIGKAGQNVRLSAKLTGWKIDIVKEGEEKAKTTDKEEKDDKDKKEDEEKATKKKKEEKKEEKTKEEKTEKDEKVEKKKDEDKKDEKKKKPKKKAKEDKDKKKDDKEKESKSKK